MTIAITFEECCGEADASLCIIDADSCAGGVELVSVVLTVSGSGVEHCARDGWLRRLFDG